MKTEDDLHNDSTFISVFLARLSAAVMLKSEERSYGPYSRRNIKRLLQHSGHATKKKKKQTLCGEERMAARIKARRGRRE